jgi:hypothetical protein
MPSLKRLTPSYETTEIASSLPEPGSKRRGQFHFPMSPSRGKNLGLFLLAADANPAPVHVTLVACQPWIRVFIPA